MPASYRNPLTIVRDAVAGAPGRDLPERVRAAAAPARHDQRGARQDDPARGRPDLDGALRGGAQDRCPYCLFARPLALGVYLAINAAGTLLGHESGRAGMGGIPVDGPRYGGADAADLELSYPVRPAGVVLSQGADLALRVHFHRPQGAAVRGPLRAGGRLFAAAGWLALAAYVVIADPAQAMITRDYVTYMTSNAVLIGAEFDKIVSILMVTGILALALRRANNFLSRATTEGITAQGAVAFFDAPVASRIRNADAKVKPGEGSRRSAAILFIDIRSFTVMAANLDPDEVVALLTAYQTRIVPIIHRHGGAIDKFLATASWRPSEPSTPAGFRRRRAAGAGRHHRRCRDLAEAPASWRGCRGAPSTARRRRERSSSAPSATSNGWNTPSSAPPVNLAAKLEKFNRQARARALTDAATSARAGPGLCRPGRPRRLRFAVSGARQAVVLHEALPAACNEIDRALPPAGGMRTVVANRRSRKSRAVCVASQVVAEDADRMAGSRARQGELLHQLATSTTGSRRRLPALESMRSTWALTTGIGVTAGAGPNARKAP